MNPVTGSKTGKRGFTDQSPESVNHQRAVNVPNNKAATQIQTMVQTNILQKKDQKVTSFGALSNIATSGLTIFFWF